LEHVGVERDNIPKISGRVITNPLRLKAISRRIRTGGEFIAYRGKHAAACG